jgi:hypothetical protein
MVLKSENRESPSANARPRSVFRGEAAWRLAMGLCLAGLTLAAAGCASVPRYRVADMLQPSNDRPWKSNMAVLPYARIRGDRVKVYNVRNCTYLDEETYVVNHEDRTYDLRDLESLDFIICPFGSMPALAHTMLSFGFRDGEYLSVSVEVRLEEHESYSPLAGALRQYEIMYVIADERDVIKLRTDVRDADVYIYRTRANPEQVRDLFVDVMMRANTLKRHPEFYDTLMNNCTTNIVAHVNRAVPGAILWDPTSLLTGYSDRMAYRLGLLVDYGSFEETKRRAHINSLAHRYADDERFSQRIRDGQMTTLWAEQSLGTQIR